MIILRNWRAVPSYMSFILKARKKIALAVGAVIQAMLV
jgi:hypothetical protein